MHSRSDIALADVDSASDLSYLRAWIGSHLRERRTKRGKRFENLKRQGYHAGWQEPIQIVIQLLDTNKQPV